jgi:hypothetical protein
VTSNLTRLRPPSLARELPHLPEIARDPVDDAQEIIARIRAAEDDATVAAADLVRVLEQLVELTVRPRRRELPVWQRLTLEQGRQFLDESALMPRTSDVDYGRLIGRLEVHLQRAIDIVDSLVSPW